MLELQILALTLVPLLAGAVTTDGEALIAPLEVIGLEERVSADFLVGTWKYSEEFFRWGITDTKRPQVRTSRGRGLMRLNADGTSEMIDLFKPAKGRWELSKRGLLLYDPRFPERGTQLLQIRKRDHDHIWVLLPFSGGATGIGLARVSDRTEIQEPAQSMDRHDKRSREQRAVPQESPGENSQSRNLRQQITEDPVKSSVDSEEWP